MGEAVVLPLRDSLQGWVVEGVFFLLFHSLALLPVSAHSIGIVFSSLSRLLPASLEWWWVGLGSCPFVAYPSCGGEWLPMMETYCNKVNDSFVFRWFVNTTLISSSSLHLMNKK